MCILKRVLTPALLIGFFAGVGLAVNTPASADSVTYARVSPASGTTLQAVELQLPDGAFCPADANRVIVRLTGPGLDAPLNVTGNTAITALDNKSYPGTAILPLVWTFTDAGGFVRPTPVVLDGDYRLTMSCLAGLSQNSLGDTVADITIDSAKGTFVVTSPNPPLVQPSGDDAAVDQGAGQAAEPVNVDAGNSDTGNTEEAVPAPVDDQESPESESNSVGSAGAEQDPLASEVAEAEPTEPSVNESTSAVDAVAGASTEQGASLLKPLLIGGGIFLLMVVVLLGLKSRRSSAS
ncbi:unannotated protein [freshwater metagenome]|uniref:Unannotated protein n=1 Tax=freshwater metagenome TaxID=449393 RepID=A0A6J7I1I7_9ZZZZ